MPVQAVRADGRIFHARSKTHQIFSTLRQINYSPDKDIVLTHACFLSLTSRAQREMRPQVPLAPLYVASYVRAHGFRASFYDTTFKKDVEEFRSDVIKNRPALIGIYVEEAFKENAARMAAVCREEGTAVIAFGPAASRDARAFLERGSGVVVAGDAEETITEILRRLKNGDADITALPAVRSVERRNTTAASIEDIDTIPFPARDMVDHAPYFAAWRARHGVSALPVSVSRGTRDRNALSYDPAAAAPFRMRSARSVAEESMFIKMIYSPDRIIFTDDAFPLEEDWLAALCRELGRRHAVLPFECTVRPDEVHEENMRLLREAGCVRIWLNAFSGSQKILDALRAGFGISDIRSAVRTARAAGMAAGVHFVLGHPEESEQDVALTRRLVKDIRPVECRVSVARPTRGTAYYEKVRHCLLPLWHAGRQDDDTILTYRAPYSQNYYDAARSLITREARAGARCGPGARLSEGFSRLRYGLFRNEGCEARGQYDTCTDNN